MDNYGPKLTISIGSIINFVSLTSMAVSLFYHTFSLGVLITLYILYMIWIGLTFSNVRTPAPVSIAEKHQIDSNNLLTTGQQLMGAIGTVFISVILASFHSLITASFVITLNFIILIGLVFFS